MASVKETVKASLVGTVEEPQLSQQVKANFLQHARKDENTGELYMTEEDFIDAVAPKQEDYVSLHNTFPVLWIVSPQLLCDDKADIVGVPLSTAQNQTRAIRNSLQSG